MRDKKLLNLTIIMQFYSGIKTINDSLEWNHSGSPAYYNLIKNLEVNPNINYNLILLDTSEGTKKIKQLKLKNLKNRILIVPYFSLIYSNKISFIKKIENFYNKFRQYILVFKYSKNSSFYYVDRDNIIFSFLVLSFQKKSKVVIRLLGVTENLFHHLTIRKNLFSKIIKSVFINPKVHFICSNDGSYAEVIQNQYLDKFHLMFNGVDSNIERDIQESEKFNIVYLSRIVKNKGHKDFINGISKSKFSNDLNVKIIGDGDLKKDMEILTKNLDLTKCINFMGRLKHSDGISELSHADLVISTNYDGVFGNTVLEALKMGIPLIVLEHPGCLSLDKYNLFVLKRDTNLDNNIAKAIDRALIDKTWLNFLKTQSEEFSSKHLIDWKKRIKQELNIVRNFFYN
jgi:glycosyltransferase involved in cell wall biosynthesis